MGHLTAIERGILATLAYFDVFEFPLRRKELIRWFFPQEPIPGLRPEDIESTLDQSEAIKGHIEQNDGWYTLRDRSSLIALRAERARFAKRKWRIAKFAAGLLRVIPFLRMAAVCNTLAIGNARDESDIDFFIIGRSHRLWTMRLLTTAWLDFARLRRKGSAIRDKICLSFYVTRDAANLEPLRLKPEDPHFLFWIDQFVPLLDEYNHDFADFQRANAWVRDRLPFAMPAGHQALVKQRTLTRTLKGFAEWTLNGRFGDWIEQKAKEFQKKKMEQNTHSLSWEHSTKVIISDNILKFHEQDRREEYRRKFETRFWDVISRVEPGNR